MSDQLTFLPEYEPPKTWETDDDYETPDPEARMLAAQVLSGDELIIDAGAGCGNITQHLIRDGRRVIAIEANPKRLMIGQERWPKALWIKKDFLNVTPWDFGNPQRVDLVIGNPPFSLLVDFINHSFGELLKPTGRIVLLLPGDTFHKPTIIKAIKQPFDLDERKVIGRISYLKDGIPQSGRQIYDSIFILSRADESSPRFLYRQNFR